MCIRDRCWADSRCPFDQGDICQEGETPSLAFTATTSIPARLVGIFDHCTGNRAGVTTTVRKVTSGQPSGPSTLDNTNSGAPRVMGVGGDRGLSPGVLRAALL